MRLYLIRHPQPLVEAGICYGSTDLLVAEDEQARALSAVLDRLQDRLLHAAPLFSSPLRRCAAFAEGMKLALGAGTLTYDPRLVEMNFGDWEMRAWNDIPRAEVDAWANDLALYRPGQGENVFQMASRVRAFYDELKQRKPDSAIVICHAGTIRMLRACPDAATPEEMAALIAKDSLRVGYGEIVILDC
jgi:alpha-ribazole phosphatase